MKALVRGVQRIQRVPASEPSAQARAPAPSLESLYREHFQFVWRNARRLGVAPSQLDDVVHDVFMVVHRQLPTYEPRSSPRAWLFSITRRIAADHRRRAGRAAGLLPLREDTTASVDTTPLRDVLARERADVVLAFLASVDDIQREVFILCELEQLSAPEIAEAVSANLSTVYTRVRSARRAFAQYVRTHCPALLGENDA